MKEFEKWIQKALNDLNSAKVLLENDLKLLDTSIYHTQQCAEKSLKAFLSFNNCDIPKSHDLNYLLDYCVKIDSDFDNLRKYAHELTIYSVEFRYPGDEMEPEIEDVKTAIVYSEYFYKLVQKKTKSV